MIPGAVARQLEQLAAEAVALALEDAKRDGSVSPHVKVVRVGTVFDLHRHGAPSLRLACARPRGFLGVWRTESLTPRDRLLASFESASDAVAWALEQLEGYT